jgi:mannose-6-phosphate isomerase-like protein (cupin superfamily)
LHDRVEIVDVGLGVAITIPIGTHFQFRSISHRPLAAVGTTIPLWPGEGETFAVEGIWEPTV